MVNDDLIIADPENEKPMLIKQRRCRKVEGNVFLHTPGDKNVIQKEREYQTKAEINTVKYKQKQEQTYTQQQRTQTTASLLHI